MQLLIHLSVLIPSENAHLLYISQHCLVFKAQPCFVVSLKGSSKQYDIELLETSLRSAT